MEGQQHQMWMPGLQRVRIVKNGLEIQAEIAL